MGIFKHAPLALVKKKLLVGPPSELVRPASYAFGDRRKVGRGPNFCKTTYLGGWEEVSLVIAKSGELGGKVKSGFRNPRRCVRLQFVHHDVCVAFEVGVRCRT